MVLARCRGMRCATGRIGPAGGEREPERAPVGDFIASECATGRIGLFGGGKGERERGRAPVGDFIARASGNRLRMAKSKTYHGHV